MKTTAGRKCSICSDSSLTLINTHIARGLSFRAISRHFFSDDSKRDSVRRHAENCLSFDSAAFIETRKIENVSDILNEVTQQLTFARKFRQAAEDWLTDPVSGAINFDPRAHELSTIYLDRNDTDKDGCPKRKKDNLQTLLDKCDGAGFAVQKTEAKTADVRKLALDAIGATDGVIDRLSRLLGAYKTEPPAQTNVQVNINQSSRLERAAKDLIDSARIIGMDKPTFRYIDESTGEIVVISGNEARRQTAYRVFAERYGVDLHELEQKTEAMLLSERQP